MGRGISFHSRTIRGRVAAAVMVLVAFGFASPAHAAVSVKLRVAAGGYSVPVKTCTVNGVAAGASGTAVLSAAVTQGCIRSFATSDGGAYITCVDPGATSICEIGEGLVTFWALYEDGVPSETGIGGFHAAAGKELALAYTNFLACPTYPDCPL